MHSFQLKMLKYFFSSASQTIPLKSLNKRVYTLLQFTVYLFEHPDLPKIVKVFQPMV